MRHRDSLGRRLPITGLPAERPRCKGCTKVLRPLSFDVDEQQPIEREFITSGRDGADKMTGTHRGVRTVTVRREFRGWDGYDGFHSLRCALDFAIAAYNAGYRLVAR